MPCLSVRLNDERREEKSGKIQDTVNKTKYGSSSKGGGSGSGPVLLRGGVVGGTYSKRSYVGGTTRSGRWSAVQGRVSERDIWRERREWRAPISNEVDARGQTVQGGGGWSRC